MKSCIKDKQHTASEITWPHGNWTWPIQLSNKQKALVLFPVTAFTRMQMDFGQIYLISIMIIHLSFTSPAFLYFDQLMSEDQ